MLPSFASMPVSVIRPALVADARNNVRADFELGTTVQCLGWLAPSTTSTSRDGGEVAVDEHLLYLPADVAVDESCAIEVAGRRWQMVGAPQTWHSPTGSLTHQQVRLVRFPS